MTPTEIQEYKRKWLMKKCYTVNVPSEKEQTCIDWCKMNVNSWEWDTAIQNKVRQHIFFFEKKEHADAFEKEFA